MGTPETETATGPVVTDEKAVPAEGGAEAAAAEAAAPEEVSAVWYYQDQVTQQPAGPWTVSQLGARWKRNALDGCTLVWREGLAGGWQPLAEVAELKETLRQLSADEKTLGDNDADAQEPAAKRARRASLDDVPLTHTYTSDEGLLYVYDTVDEDWKLSDVYEALLAEEGQLDIAGKSVAAVSSTATVSLNTEAANGNRKAQLPSDQAKQGTKRAHQPTDIEAEMKAFLEETDGVGESMRVKMKASEKAAAEKKAAEEAAAQAEAANGEGDGAEERTENLTEAELKAKKRREYRERKKLKRQAGVFVKSSTNPNVYVSGLPPDVTTNELEPVFKRAGVLKLDLDTGAAKIRIYRDGDGKCNGGALVTYANPASVELALKFLHEHELRPKCTISVQQADFEETEKKVKMSKEELQVLAATRKKQVEVDRKKFLAAKNAQQEAVSWSGEMDDGSGRRIVVLKHMFSLEEAVEEGPQFYKELVEEIQEECEKVGVVQKVTPMEGHRQGIVCVKFKLSCEAEECIRVMDGRFFAGRTVEAYFYDGVTDLKALGGMDKPVAAAAAAAAVATAAPAATAAQETPAAAEAADATAAIPTAPTAPAAAPAAAAVAAATLGQAASSPEETTPKDAVEAPSVQPASAEAEEGSPAAPKDGAKTWDDWLNDQSSDEELMVQTE
eukprot:TRINITY_DN125_c0_g2_i1.p1 TRINITY_DN125_c0_g2~~TRINITY_DN125_c0_g2_i1.p1  ORF type:complete len:698 (-),score=225.48 TRINITY_DN125_c0_g2_i1:124-2139(-)